MKPSVMTIVGNWKMNGHEAASAEIAALRSNLRATPEVAVAVCPPFTLIHRVAELLAGSEIRVGGQDCHAHPKGAFTGSISAEQLAEAGADLVIVGHSERRAGCAETDDIVADKSRAAIRAGLEPVVCVGETLGQRESGETLAVIAEQLTGSLPDQLSASRFAVAYEPVWAIGTGLTPSTDQIAEVHEAIRAALSRRFGEAAGRVPILYGGSVSPANADEILAVEGVDGALVGGASLKAGDFLAIVAAAGRVAARHAE